MVGGDSSSPGRQDVLLASVVVANGLRETTLSVPAISCGGCIRKIEQALNALDGVVQARVNLSTRRVTIRWRDAASPPPFMDTLIELGYQPHLLETGAEPKDGALRELVIALAVAGFGAGNIMMLSVSVWSGAAPETRNILHIISALIALPVLAFSGRIFFRSAWQALRHGRTNMDVPISIGVLLAFALSLYDTIDGGRHAYFDASVMLLFFLLIGRTLDHMMREKARLAVAGLARLAARSALVIGEDGERTCMPTAEIEPGMTLLVAAGERVPVDGAIEAGTSDLDCSLVTGESVTHTATTGEKLQEGVLNLTGPLTIKATAAAKDSFLAEMVRLMETAEAGRAGYRRLADRAAALYAPVVHLAALIGFVAWMMMGADIHQAITIAIAVLIITCPCALGLAVPMVQVVAARRLFEQGILIKDGGALERLADIDSVMLDKTGTLTLGQPILRNRETVDPVNLTIAVAMAAHSRHPLSKALLAADVSGSHAQITFEHCSEQPGFGLEAESGSDIFRLGRPAWAADHAAPGRTLQIAPGTVLSKNGKAIEAFDFEDTLRPGVREMLDRFEKLGLRVGILSGDHQASVRRVALDLDITDFHADMRPGDKASHLAKLAKEGRKVLMVGDGLNGAPALADAHASMAPGSAADIGRNAADVVFLRDSAKAVSAAIDLSRRAKKLIRQNFALAVVYNLIAMAGLVTPFGRRAGDVLLIDPRGRQRSAPGPRHAFGKADTQREPADRHGLRPGWGGRRMNALFYLIPISLLLGAVGLAAFLWSVRTSQYEDLDGAAERVIADDDDKPLPKRSGKNGRI